MTDERQSSSRDSSPALRFGCGAIIGAGIGLALVAYLVGPNWPAAAAIVGAATIGGWLAYRFGDRVLIPMMEIFFYSS